MAGAGCRKNRCDGDDGFLNLVPSGDDVQPITFVEKVVSKKPVEKCGIKHFGIRATLANGKVYFVHKVLDKRSDASRTMATNVTDNRDHYTNYEIHDRSDSTSVPLRRSVSVPDLVDASDEKKCGLDFHYVQNNCKHAMSRMYKVAIGKTEKKRRSVVQPPPRANQGLRNTYERSETRRRSSVDWLHTTPTVRDEKSFADEIAALTLMEVTEPSFWDPFSWF